MMAVVIQHSFGSTCHLQGSVDSLGIAIGITQAVVVAFALPDTILQINLCGVVFGDMFLYEIGNTRIPERPTEGKYCSKGICFPETHGCSSRRYCHSCPPKSGVPGRKAGSGHGVYSESLLLGNTPTNTARSVRRFNCSISSPSLSRIAGFLPLRSPFSGNRTPIRCEPRFRISIHNRPFLLIITQCGVLPT